MEIEFDADKRDKTFAERGLDFARADELFASPAFNKIDDRHDYHEQRNMTFGLLDARWVILVWTSRGARRRVISMRYANGREIAKYADAVG